MYQNQVFDEANLPINLVGRTFINCDFVGISFETRICTPEQFRNCNFMYCSGINSHYETNGNSII